MPSSGRAEDLYQADAIARVIAAGGAVRFERFSEDLVDLFSLTCLIHRKHAPLNAADEWRAEHKGAVMNVRAWVLELKEGVTQADLLDKCKCSMSPGEYERRLASNIKEPTSRLAPWPTLGWVSHLLRRRTSLCLQAISNVR